MLSSGVFSVAHYGTEYSISSVTLGGMNHRLVSRTIVCFIVSWLKLFSHIRPLGAAGALAVDICICFHDIESYIFAKLFPSLAV